MIAPEQPYQSPSLLPPRKTSGLAITSLVMGIISILGGAYFLVPPFLAVLFGHLSLKPFKTNQLLDGKGMAIAGLIMGWLGLGAWILIFLFFGGLVSLAAISNSIDSANGTNPGKPAFEVVIENIPTTYRDIDTFSAVNYVSVEKHEGAISVCRFNQDGVVSGSAFPVKLPGIHPLNQIAIDEQTPTIYGATTHKVGEIERATGEFKEFNPPFEMSWVSAIAFDSKNRNLIVASRSGLFFYNPQTNEWSPTTTPSRSGLLISLTYDETNQLIYGIHANWADVENCPLVKMNHQCAVLSAVKLSHPLPVTTHSRDRIQLVKAGDQLVILIAPHHDRYGKLNPGGTLLIDPDTGNLQRISEESDTEDPEPAVLEEIPN